MSSQEVLVVWVLDIPDNDAASSNQDVLTHAWMQVNGVHDRATEANGVVQLDLATTGDLSLPECTICDIRLSWCLKLLGSCWHLSQRLFHHFSIFLKY